SRSSLGISRLRCCFPDCSIHRALQCGDRGSEGIRGGGRNSRWHAAGGLGQGSGRPPMLYSRWQETLSRHRDRIAVIDADGSRTFAELAGRLETVRTEGPVVFARGKIADIAVAVLAGWRDGLP